MATCAITRGGKPIYSVEFSASAHQGENPIQVNERQDYGFDVEDREPDTEYGIWLGDIEAGQATRRDGKSAATIGIGHRQYATWDDALYFEGARGLVWITLKSRKVDGDPDWNERLSFPVVVATGKISSDRYSSMLEQLSTLAVGLVLDLVSKSFRATTMSFVSNSSAIRSSAVELRILETIWPEIARCLDQISRTPAMRIRRRLVTRNCWGSEPLGSRAVAMMATLGNDPRRGNVAIPFRTQVSQIIESQDTIEHRTIRSFLDLLFSRVLECRANILKHISGIKQNRKWRDRSEFARNLYSTEDLPRLTKLNDRLERAQFILEQISLAQHTEPFCSVKPRMDLQLTPVFANIESYRSIRDQMLRFLKAGLIVIDEGSDERIKDTSRIYEQWAFLQIIAAFRAAGLSCESQQGILHSSKMFRYTLDLDRGARVTFQSENGRSIVVRYEPWVMPRESAIQSRDTVYRGRHGDGAWSPDIMIEFISESDEGERYPLIDYAVVVDAKYSSEIREHHWKDTSKYLEIRATATGKQVVKQQWLVFPGDDIREVDSSIFLRDSTIGWSESGPNCGRDETVQGMIKLTPPLTFDSESINSGWIQKPESAVCEFVNGLLRFMGIEKQ